VSYQVAFLLGGKKIVPAPKLRLARQAERSADGTVRRRYWTVTVAGEVAAFAGSPDHTGAFWTAAGYPPAPDPAENDASLRVRNLREKLGALGQLFAQEPLLLEVIPGDGSASIRSVLRATQFTFADGPWFNTVEFTLEGEADAVWFGGRELGLGDADQAPEETWGFEPADDVSRSYKLTHTVVASSRKTFAADGTVLQEGWERARDLAAAAAGYDAAFLGAAGFLDASAFSPHNYTRGVQTDKAGGRVTLTETWLCYDPAAAGPTGQTAGRALEEFSTELRYDRESGRSQVTLSGTITGLEERESGTGAVTVGRMANANLRYAAVLPALPALADAAGGGAMNPSFVSSTVGRNALTGVLTYSRTFDDSLAARAGTLSEQVEVELENPTPAFAEFVIPGRAGGPIFQPLDTPTKRAATVTASFVVPVTYSNPTPAWPDFDPFAAVVAAAGLTPSFLVSDRERKDARNGRYSRTTSYVFGG
jgi:hypothetical protein